MNDTTYRRIYVGLGLALAAVIALTIAYSPSGTETPLPEPIERIFPLPNDSVIRQARLEIDMKVGYEIVLFVDGFRISPVEIGVQTGTNRYVWEPAPGRFLETWGPGTHQITVEWDRITGLPDPGSYSWSFRVQ
jgi:hypothetical protein